VNIVATDANEFKGGLLASWSGARVPVKDVGRRILRVWSLALTFRALALIKVRSSTDGVRYREHRMKLATRMLQGS
jgi:hypothetical protein